MPTLEDAKADQFRLTTTVTLTGVPLEVSADHPLRERGHVPINPYCLCVTEPCICPPVAWLPQEVVLQAQPTDKKNANGELLTEYTLAPDATIVLDVLAPITAGAFARALLGTSGVDLTSGLPGPGGPPGPIVPLWPPRSVPQSFCAYLCTNPWDPTLCLALCPGWPLCYSPF
jgi:hypothetical protein